MESMECLEYVKQWKQWKANGKGKKKNFVWTECNYLRTA